MRNVASNVATCAIPDSHGRALPAQLKSRAANRLNADATRASVGRPQACTKPGRRETFMPTRITQVETPERDSTVLRVEGSLYLADAELLERLCRDIGRDSGRAVTLDLADLSFIDSESAGVLSRLKREWGVKLEGL